MLKSSSFDLAFSKVKGGKIYEKFLFSTDIKECKAEIKGYLSKICLTFISFSLTLCCFLFSKSSKTYLANEWVTLVTADIHPLHPNSNPFNSFASEPGNILKSGILRFSNKL